MDICDNINISKSVDFESSKLKPVEHIAFNKNYNSVAIASENKISFYYRKEKK